MNKNQKGFSALMVVAAIAVVGLVVGATWHFTQRNESKKSNSTTAGRSAEVKSYTDSAKLYSLSYPAAWTVEEAADCCDGEPKDYTKVSRSVTIVPPAKADVHGYGVSIQADRTNLLASTIEQNWKDNKHQPELKTIGGYSTKYVKVAFNGDAENYIDHNYLITHDGSSVYVSFREKYYHQYPAEDWSASRDMKAFNGLVDSIKFLD